MPHTDILDRPEPLTVPFWMSLALHLSILGFLAAGAIVSRNHLNMGSPTGGGIGVLINPVSSIPLPNRGGAENPVANDTQSQMPTPPAPKAKPKPAPKPKAPSPDEMLLRQMEKAPNKRPQQAAQPNKFREQQTYAPNQLYSDSGQRMSSSQFAMAGGGGVRLGDNTPFGQQFAPYANIIRDKIARNWNPTDLAKTSASPFVVVTFTIRRDGSVDHVAISKTSGIPTMDFSAQRAVENAQLPPLPSNFPRNQADVELKFELGN
jgi:periplasmic protein TonB